MGNETTAQAKSVKPRRDEAFKLGQIVAWELALKVMEAQRRHIGRLEARVTELEQKIL